METARFNQSFRYLVCADIANGMAYLHRQNIIHGNLTIDKCHVTLECHVTPGATGKCHVDSRWNIKITDWEYSTLYDVIRHQSHAARGTSVLHFVCGSKPTSFGHLAPEIRRNGCLCEPTRAGDVYSFGVIIHDVVTQVVSQSSGQ